MQQARTPRTTADWAVLPLLPGERKHEWVYRQIATAIHQGHLGPQQGVPSTRVLAARWGVSRGIVERVFEELTQEGYLQTTVGSGTKVSSTLPDTFVQPSSSFHSRPAGEIQRPAALVKKHPVQAARPFIARLPDAVGFNIKAWRECLIRATRQLDPSTMSDADPAGLRPLREEICKHLAISRGVLCSPDNVIVVTGIRHAIDLISRIAVPAGGSVGLEDPGYSGAANIFHLNGRMPVPISVDSEGIEVKKLHESRVSLVYVTPAHQAPTGVVMSPARRSALLEWAVQKDCWILEDDYDSDFCYEMAPPVALKSNDLDDRVILCGSFNKSIYSSLRIGYIVSPNLLIPPLLQARGVSGRANSVLDQLALLDFMRTGAFNRHLKQIRVAYKSRRDIILRELKICGWADEDFNGTHGGFHFTLRLPNGVEEEPACAALLKAGIEVQGLSSFAAQISPHNFPALIIGYTALTDAQCKWSARQMGEVLDSLSRSLRSTGSISNTR